MYIPMPCKMSDTLVCLALAVLLMGGCASSPSLPVEGDLLPPDQPASQDRGSNTGQDPQPANKQKTVEQQLAELEQHLAANEASFQLGKGDVLSISVYDEPDLTLESVPVRPDGMIAFPLIGDVQVAGRSVEAITAEIRERLLQFVLEPRVSVVVREFNSCLLYTSDAADDDYTV